MKFDDDFKQALKMLSNAEKDKLILRLLKKDDALARKLYFELVDTDSVEEKRQMLKSQIDRMVERSCSTYYSPGYLMMELREISGLINEHVATTKDKLGEIALNCHMLRRTLELGNNLIAKEKYGKAYKLSNYIVARLFKILILIQKQHEDMHLEFNDDVVEIGNLLGQNPNLMKTAIYNRLDVNWLIRFEIPENLAEMHKQIRAEGYLK